MRCMYYAGQVSMTVEEAIRAYSAGAMSGDNLNLIGCRSGKLVAVSRSSDSKYKSNDFPMWNAICDCGNLTTLDSNDLIGYGPKRCCERCSEESRERRNYPEYREWMIAVYKKDGYTCQKCGASTDARLHAHHIEGYADHRELRTNLENGIVLCDKHHRELHSLYGNDVGIENLKKWLNEPMTED